MNKTQRRWNMYIQIHQLNEINLNVSQIARHLNISRNTVYKYLDMSPEEFNEFLENMKTRKKN